MLKVLLCVAAFVSLANCAEDIYEKYFDIKDKESVIPIANFAGEKLSKTFLSEFHYKLVKVVNAEYLVKRPITLRGVSEKITVMECRCRKFGKVSLT